MTRWLPACVPRQGRTVLGRRRSRCGYNLRSRPSSAADVRSDKLRDAEVVGHLCRLVRSAADPPIETAAEGSYAWGATAGGHGPCVEKQQHDRHNEAEGHSPGLTACPDRREGDEERCHSQGCGGLMSGNRKPSRLSPYIDTDYIVDIYVGDPSTSLDGTRLEGYVLTGEEGCVHVIHDRSGRPDVYPWKHLRGPVLRMTARLPRR
jgi:hypothetical protein